MVIGQGIIHNHTVNPELALLSDHHALTFTLSNPRELEDNLTEAKYNWKDANEEDFIEALEQEIHTDTKLFEKSIQQVLNKHRNQVSPDELNSAVRYTKTSTKHDEEKTVHTHRMCS